MSSTLSQLFARVCKRDPDFRDLELLRELSQNLPDSVTRDVGMMTEIVIRADHIRQLEAILERAGNIACRKAEIDGERHAIDVANKVWRRVMDQLPVDSFVTMRRWLLLVIVYAILTWILGFAAGWSLRQQRYYAARESHQAATEQQFNRCIDAAEGHALASGGTGTRYAPEVFRTQARACAAEYADRRENGF